MTIPLDKLPWYLFKSEWIKGSKVFWKDYPWLVHWDMSRTIYEKCNKGPKRMIWNVPSVQCCLEKWIYLSKKWNWLCSWTLKLILTLCAASLAHNCCLAVGKGSQLEYKLRSKISGISVLGRACLDYSDHHTRSC